MPSRRIFRRRCRRCVPRVTRIPISQVCCAGSARRRRRIFLVVTAVRRRAFPCLNLPYMVNLSEVKNRSALATHSCRDPRAIELTGSEIRIAVTIPKDAAAITAFALIKSLGSVRFRFIKHEVPHRCMVKIAERREVCPRIAHDFLRPGWEQPNRERSRTWIAFERNLNRN